MQWGSVLQVLNSFSQFLRGSGIGNKSDTDTESIHPCGWVAE